MSLDSTRLAALKQMTTFLMSEITTANGYDVDLTDKIFRGRSLYGYDAPLPMVSILEGMDPDRGPVSVGYHRNEQKDQWTLLFQGWQVEDPVNPTDPAHNLMAAVKKGLGKVRQQIKECQFAGTPMQNMVDLVIEPGVVRPPDNLSEKSYFWMRVIPTMVEDVDAPFWSP